MGVMSKQGEDGTVGRESAETRFERLYAEYGRAVLTYAVRRSDPQDGADVVAETFLVAWRRLDDVPPGDRARLWLYGVARHVLANQRRSKRRLGLLAERLRRELPGLLDDMPAPESGAGAVASALAQLGPEDQEILRLSAWEELSPSEIATVLRIGQVAARSRLHRARHRLQAALRAAEPEDCNALHLQEAR